MLYSLILRTATRLIVPLMLLFSVFVLLRGHDSPGGGFVGGLVAASAFALFAFSRGFQAASRVVLVPPRDLIGAGLVCALGAGVLAWVLGEAFLQSLWAYLDIGLGEVKLGTTLLFDIGVYLVVIGTVLLMIFSIEDRDSALTDRL